MMCTTKIVLSFFFFVLLLQSNVIRCDDATDASDATISANGCPSTATSSASDDPSPTSDPNSYDNCRDKVCFDYIVIGVGQTGSVVAARLAQFQNGKFRVLGIDGGNRTHRSLNGTDYVASQFNYDNKTNTYSLGRPFTRFDVPTFIQSTYVPPTPYVDYKIIMNGALADSQTARLLGGSGVHNGMTWNRFTKPTIDGWGVNNWTYNDCLPFYKKSEDASATYGGKVNPSYHGFSGPIGLSDPPQDAYYTPTVSAWLTACTKHLPNNTDFDGPSRYGCGTQKANIRKGVRSSAANEYLPPAIARGNLHLALNALATTLIFTKVGGVPKAIGVRYFQNGVNKTAYASKEIILCLGAIFTPALLQRSGVGDATLLTSLGIPVVLNNSYVGRNLGINQLYSAEWQYRDNVTFPNAFGTSPISVAYAVSQSGPWGTNGNMGFAYLCVNDTGVCPDPDIMLGTNGAVYTSPPIMGSFVDVETCRSKNRGVLTINTTDPFAPPLVNMPTFGSPADVDALVYGLKYLRMLLNTYPLTSIFAGEVAPGPAYVTDTDLKNYLFAHPYITAHWVGTTKMGNDNDTTAVVNTRLQVRGITGLRVGDTSVLPSVNSHSQGSGVMAAERCACFILGC